MQQGNQCIFCQLISNPEQLILVGETENFYAWLDIQPRAKGHTMVVPKEHIESATEFSPKMWDEGMRLAREVVEKAEKGIGAEGASITINIKEAGGQMMPHAYIQVFPRFTEDESAGTPTGAIFQHREDLQDENKLREIASEMDSVDVDFGEEAIEPHPESQKFQQETGSEPEPEEQDKKREKTSRKDSSFEWV